MTFSMTNFSISEWSTSAECCVETTTFMMAAGLPPS